MKEIRIIDKDERDLQKDLEICEKATPGSWRWYAVEYGCGECECEFGNETEDEGGLKCESVEIYNGAYVSETKKVEHGDYVDMNNEDAKFIAQAREGWPEAIKRAQRDWILCKVGDGD